jgi:hypothetical protein
VRPGVNTFRIKFVDLRLLPGQYYLGINLGAGRGFESYISEAVSFEVTASDEASAIDAQLLGGALVASATVSSID